MKLIDIPPYKREGLNYDRKEGHFMINELLEKMRRKGQLEGVSIDIDDGYPTEHTGTNRDEEVLAYLNVGVIKRVREICETGKYDAIVTHGPIEPGFFASRMISKIPIAFCLHSAVHVASLLGDRFSIVGSKDPGTLIYRHFVQLYGLGNKLVSVRNISNSPPNMVGLLHRYKGAERMKIPEMKKIVDDVVDHSIRAIEQDRVDSIIIGGPYFEVFEDEIRQSLDEGGYGEIQLICMFSSAVEMAKAMVNMKLIQAPRAYPSDNLKAKPEFR
jgi:allantoin racemase